MPPKTRRLSLKDVVSKMNTKGGGDGSQGLTLSESIRNSGKVLEEHEMKIRQLNNLTEALTNTVRTKDEAMLAMQAAMQDKLDKKSKDVEHLQVAPLPPATRIHSPLPVQNLSLHGRARVLLTAGPGF